MDSFQKRRQRTWKSAFKSCQKGVSLMVYDARYVPAGSSYTIADMITGYGVAESVIHFYKLQGDGIQEKKY